MIVPEMKAPPADAMTAVTSKYTEAFNLNAKICISAQMAQQNLYEVCKGLKEMRDGKLYKELGYQNFEDYTENEVGITRRQAYNFINIIEAYGENVKSISHFGTTKLALLTKLDESQREEIKQNVNVEEVSVRELKEKIRELKIKADKADMLSSRLDDMNMNCDRIAQQRDKAESRIRQLEGTIEELESRPVEVAVQSDTAEIEKLNSIIKQTDLDWGKKYSELEEENIKLRREDFQKHTAEMEQLKSDYERRLAEVENASSAESVPDTKEVFKAYLSNAVDAAKRLISFVKKYPDETIFRDKTKELFNNIIQNTEE